MSGKSGTIRSGTIALLDRQAYQQACFQYLMCQIQQWSFLSQYMLIKKQLFLVKFVGITNVYHSPTGDGNLSHTHASDSCCHHAWFMVSVTFEKPLQKWLTWVQGQSVWSSSLTNKSSSFDWPATRSPWQTVQNIWLAERHLYNLQAGDKWRAGLQKIPSNKQEKYFVTWRKLMRSFRFRIKGWVLGIENRCFLNKIYSLFLENTCTNMSVCSHTEKTDN